MKHYSFFYKKIYLWAKQSYLAVYLRILFSKLIETSIYTKYMASYGMLSNPKKLRTHIMIKAHAFEKGMSIGTVRYGFGKQKAFDIFKDLQKYLKMGGEKSFANECCSIINSYIKFNEKGGVDMGQIKDAFTKFCTVNSIELFPYGGNLVINHDCILKGENSSFKLFSQVRYGIRDFGDVSINKSNIEKALKLCERTPTACNRQNQRIHIYIDQKKKDKICNLQGGCKGFIENMQGAILVCENLIGYSSSESNLPFVDGGLYSMNLMYALNYYDIATIPLTMGHKAHYNIRILKEMEIGLNEVPVLLIAIGSYKNKWRVAQSHRYSWENYTTFDR